MRGGNITTGKREILFYKIRNYVYPKGFSEEVKEYIDLKCNYFNEEILTIPENEILYFLELNELLENYNGFSEQPRYNRALKKLKKTGYLPLLKVCRSLIRYKCYEITSSINDISEIK